MVRALNEWESFFLAQAGASAALAGLVFVSVSLNIGDVLSAPVLASRAMEALLFLVTILVASSLTLVPGQSGGLLGAELLLGAFGLWLVVLRVDAGIRRQTAPQFQRHARIVTGLNQVVLLLYALAGAHLVAFGSDGMYWLVPAIGLSYFKSLTDAWVLLVEIKR